MVVVDMLSLEEVEQPATPNSAIQRNLNLVSTGEIKVLRHEDRVFVRSMVIRGPTWCVHVCGCDPGIRDIDKWNQNNPECRNYIERHSSWWLQ